MANAYIGTVPFNGGAGHRRPAPESPDERDAARRQVLRIAQLRVGREGAGDAVVDARTVLQALGLADYDGAL